MVRPGISLFGSMPSPVLIPVLDKLVEEKRLAPFRPVMCWKTKVIQVQSLRKGTPVSYGGRYTTTRDSRIATLPVGYADGLSRHLSNNMELLIKGKRVKQVGTICMDMCLIDVTNIPDVAMGEEVVIFGNQGEAQISVDELATRAETIPYEILCGVGKRVPRIYLP
jgi:alanine racemase